MAEQQSLTSAGPEDVALEVKSLRGGETSAGQLTLESLAAEVNSLRRRVDTLESELKTAVVSGSGAKQVEVRCYVKECTISATRKCTSDGCKRRLCVKHVQHSNRRDMCIEHADANRSCIIL